MTEASPSVATRSQGFFERAESAEKKLQEYERSHPQSHTQSFTLMSLQQNVLSAWRAGTTSMRLDFARHVSNEALLDAFQKTVSDTGTWLFQCVERVMGPAADNFKWVHRTDHSPVTDAANEGTPAVREAIKTLFPAVVPADVSNGGEALCEGAKSEQLQREDMAEKYQAFTEAAWSPFEKLVETGSKLANSLTLEGDWPESAERSWSSAKADFTALNPQDKAITSGVVTAATDYINLVDTFLSTCREWRGGTSLGQTPPASLSDFDGKMDELTEATAAMSVRGTGD